MKAVRRPIIRGTDVTGYDSDKFGTVEYLQRRNISSTLINRVHFITDSGYQTWRNSTNLKVYNGERGNIGETIGEEFYESRS